MKKLLTLTLAMMIILSSCSSNNINEHIITVEESLSLIGSYEDMFVLQDGNNIIIVNSSAEVIDKTTHNYKEDTYCCYYENTLYINELGTSVIHYHDINNIDKETGSISVPDSDSISKMVYHDGILYILARSTYDYLNYLYSVNGSDITRLSVGAMDSFDFDSSGNLIYIISDYEGKKSEIYSYDFASGVQTKLNEFDYLIQGIFGGRNESVIIVADNSIKEYNKGKVYDIYINNKNGRVYGQVITSEKNYFFTDSYGSRFIKLPFGKTLTAEAVDEISDIEPVKSFEEFGLDTGRYDSDIDQTAKKSDESFELVIITKDGIGMETRAEKLYKKLYPNARIKYTTVAQSGIQMEGGNPYETAYEQQLKLKIMAGDSDYDLFYISSPESLCSIVHSGGYYDLSAFSDISAQLDKMFIGIKSACIYENTVFGIPKKVTFKGTPYNAELAAEYGIDYDFKKEPLKITGLNAFASKYCKVPDVYMGYYTSYTNDYNIERVMTNFALGSVYENLHIDYLRKSGSYIGGIYSAYSKIEASMKDYFMPLQDMADKKMLFGMRGDAVINIYENNDVTFDPVPDEKEIYIGSFTYMCVNKFSKASTEHVSDFIQCVIDERCIDPISQAVYDAPELYRSYISSGADDTALTVQYNFYKRIADNCVPESVISWDAYTALKNAIGIENIEYMKGNITEDEMYSRFNDKLHMIFNE